ncbi:MAG: DUF4293 domain-containing protein [Bacteroidia bacterium]
MIQRIQSLFLAFVGVLFFVLLFIPVLQYTVGKTTETFSLSLLDLPLALIGQVLLDFVAVFAIIRFKNRSQQILICRIGLLLSVFFTAALIALPSAFASLAPNQTAVPAIGAWLTILNILCFFLAAYFIRKDEELVRSADRLR